MRTQLSRASHINTILLRAAVICMLKVWATHQNLIRTIILRSSSPMILIAYETKIKTTNKCNYVNLFICMGVLYCIVQQSVGLCDYDKIQLDYK